MFGFVMADVKELTKEQEARYTGVYCGICRRIRLQSSGLSRLGLQYDMAFLALLHMSLYEPEEERGKRACGLHPIKPRPWIDNAYVAYSADMNVALAYYKSLDDYADEQKFGAKIASKIFSTAMEDIKKRYPRQCEAIRLCIEELSNLEQEGCQNPDLPAGCFGRLMGELCVYEEDMWAETLREMGNALGRFIYLADAAVDYRSDLKKGNYNPYIAMGTGEDFPRWEEYLVMTMGRCTNYFERLPLVQDKEILNNILYGGVWLAYRSQIRGDKK